MSEIRDILKSVADFCDPYSGKAGINTEQAEIAIQSLISRDYVPKKDSVKREDVEKAIDSAKKHKFRMSDVYATNDNYEIVSIDEKSLKSLISNLGKEKSK